MNLPACQRSAGREPVDNEFAEIVRHYARAIAVGRPWIQTGPPRTQPPIPVGLLPEEADSIDMAVKLGSQSCVFHRLHYGALQGLPKRRPRSLLLESQGCYVFLCEMIKSSKSERIKDLLGDCYCIGYESARNEKIVDVNLLPRSMPRYDVE